MQVATSPVHSQAVQEFLASNALSLFISGEWRPSKRGAKFQTLDPGLGTVLAEVFDADRDDVDAAVQAARSAFKNTDWARMKPNQRGVYLHRLADLVDRDRNILAEIEALDVGKPIPQAQWDVENFSATLRYYSDLALHVSYRDEIPVKGHEARTVRHPYGVCGFIFPWNFPFLLVGWGISPALAAGNAVVIKPAEDTPLSALYLTKLVKESGIPDGVVNVVPGLGHTAGAALAGHPDLNRMSFTGSPEVGRLVAATCGQNLVPVKLELGGKGAALVFEDADVDRAAEQLTSAVTLNAGQVCCTATRWVVQEKVYDRFVAKAVDVLKRIRIGYCKDSQTQMGPVVSRKQRDRVLGYIVKARQEGAEVLLEGGEAEQTEAKGFYVKPAMLAGSADNVAAREEIFGPVAFMLKFGTEDDAIALVNRSPYGLANSIWTRNLKRADHVAEELIAGNSWINAHNVFVHGVPYAGVNLSGMGGGVLGPETFFDYLRPQSVVRPL
jgi:acyl-CoA reductase-like NAD-dependent aldehyde dehydrogenase